MTKTKENKARWTDETKPIISTNGEIVRDYIKYFINADISISPDVGMTSLELHNIIGKMDSLVRAYQANKQYLV